VGHSYAGLVISKVAAGRRDVQYQFADLLDGIACTANADGVIT
jgi:hypothetical protein